MAARLKHLRVNPTGEHVGTVIFLHGLGDTGRGWLQAAQWLQLPGIRFILPHAPEIPITLNRGMRMPGWFDINQLDRLQDSKHDDEKGMMESVASVEALIQSEIDAGIPANKIVVGGFSQGGAIALLLGLKTEKKLAGVAALSTWVTLNHKIKEIASPNAKDTPVFWGHGTDDQVVNYEYGQRSVELLKSLGFPPVKSGAAFSRPGLRFESYPGLPHSSCTEELADLKAWLIEAFKDQA